jgi:AcrR family transcriptional regulator
MAIASAKGAEDPNTRTALLDATEQVIFAEGYAAATTRRVAKQADVNPGLVYYYFGPIENLLLEVFRRRAELMLGRQAEALDSTQPLWALWELIHDQANVVLNLEFLAMGNHHKAVRAEIRKYSKQFRRLQLKRLAVILPTYGVDTDVWAPETVMLFMDGVSRFLLSEQAYDVRLGHAKTIATVERLIRSLEGDRKRGR